MNQITTVKKIRLQGTSLVVIATKELSMLGLTKEDTVEVTFKRVTADPNEDV